MSFYEVSLIRHVCRSLTKHCGFDASPLRHVGLRWVFVEACRGLQRSMSLSDGSSVRHVNLRWVSDMSPIKIQCKLSETFTTVLRSIVPFVKNHSRENYFERD